MNPTRTTLLIAEIQTQIINAGAQKQDQHINNHGLVELELETDARPHCAQFLVIGEQVEGPHVGLLLAAGTHFLPFRDSHALSF